ncbi:MAG TPA: hypothetical protein IAB59_01200 [Candidatus Onthousia faecipullorum]|uniref:Uncharacterized protein n=1 Tax=Candidatus Onthousia faecipullorum TaxID=2840887 RepID=A0A9D1G9U4_9FIRM|nr:hypothetical protein [Candidatus Onthousia faecipullorum]
MGDTLDKIKVTVGIGVIVLVCGYNLVRCGSKLSSNRDNLDTEKSFNAVMDENENSISISLIDGYSDYNGSTYQFRTRDGLVVLTDSKDSQLLRVDSFEELSSYAEIFANGNSDKVASYDELQGLSVDVDYDSFTKEYFDMNYDFDSVLIEGEDGIAIFDISSWRDWDDDDKVQLSISDGPVILKDMGEVKLLNSENADENSIYNYALTLAGSEDRVFNHSDKVKVYK